MWNKALIKSGFFKAGISRLDIAANIWSVSNGLWIRRENEKKYNYYLIIWGILFALFLLIAILVPTALKMETEGYAIGLIGVIIAFFGELACAKKVFSQGSLQKFFYNIPMLKIAHGGLYCIAVVGIACMVVPYIPAWAGAVACLLILAFTAIAVVKANAAAELVAEVDEKVSSQTEVMKQLRAKASALVPLAQDEETKAALSNLAEALRYSDPVSSPATVTKEAEITVLLEEVKKSLESRKSDGISAQLSQLERLVAERNLLKRNNR